MKIYFVGAVILVLLAAGGFLLWQQQSSNSQSNSATSFPMTKGTVTFSSDGKQVFVNLVGNESSNSKIIQGADPATFTVVGVDTTGSLGAYTYYAKDKNNVYTGFVCGDQGCSGKEGVLQGADISTFVYVTNFGDFSFAKDKRHVYSGGQVLEGADPATFRVERDANSGYIVRDSAKIFFHVDENFNSVSEE